MPNEETRRLNKKAFNDLFESIAAVMCAFPSHKPETMEELNKFVQDFMECAKEAKGKCLKLGIDVFSSIVEIPKAAIADEIAINMRNYVQQNKED